MINYYYILILIAGLTSTSLSQYLSYQELKSLLDIAKDEVKADDYLVSRGFEFEGGNSNEERKIVQYSKYIGQDDYIVTIVDNMINYVNVQEHSMNINRWKQYKNIVTNNGFKQTKSETEENGYMSIYYQKNELEITLTRGTNANGAIYRFLLSKNY